LDGLHRLTDNADAMQASPAGGQDGFVSILPRMLSRVAYSSYAGGSSDDNVYGVAVRSEPKGARPLHSTAEDVYLFLITASLDLRVSPSAFQPTFGGGDGSLCGIPCDDYVMRFALPGDDSGAVHRGPPTKGARSRSGPLAGSEGGRRD